MNILNKSYKHFKIISFVIKRRREREREREKWQTAYAKERSEQAGTTYVCASNLDNIVKLYFTGPSEHCTYRARIS